MRVIITVGVSGSGKSTFAREWTNAQPGNRVEINRDNIRKELMTTDGDVFRWSEWKWKREDEVTSHVTSQILEAVDAKKDIIISDTNLHDGRRQNMIKEFESHGYEVEIMDFPITYEEAVKRDLIRENSVGASVIMVQYKRWLKYIGRRTYIPDLSKPTAIICDIDGTLAHMDGKRGAFEWSRVGEDSVDNSVKLVVDLISANTGIKVILLSGRDGVCKPETIQWLEDNGIWYWELHMRTPNDQRKDTIVKEEMFWGFIANNYNVQFVIDDRPAVCRMWRELGLKTFQAGDPHVEF